MYPVGQGPSGRGASGFTTRVGACLHFRRFAAQSDQFISRLQNPEKWLRHPGDGDGVSNGLETPEDDKKHEKRWKKTCQTHVSGELMGTVNFEACGIRGEK